MNTLKKSMLLLLLACLCACGREENLVAQNKPKQKTVKEALCREWHLESDTYNNKLYTKDDIFKLIFYENHTFIFYSDQEFKLTNDNTNILKGTWRFKDPTIENLACVEGGVCFPDGGFEFSCENINNHYNLLADVFVNKRDVRITHLHYDKLQFGGVYTLLKPILLNFTPQIK
jgi:hypothetical protein